MGLLKCEDCGKDISDQAVSCPNCGRPILAGDTTQNNAVSLARIPAHIIGLIGASALLISPFLTWVSASIVEVSGFERGKEDAIVIAILGVIALVPPLSSFSSRIDKHAWLSIVVGIVAGMLSYFHYSSVQEQIATSSSLIQPRVGIGLYVCIGGAVLTILGAIGTVKLK